MTYNIMETTTRLRADFEPILWYFGGVMKHNGKLKAVWTEPGRETDYLGEAQLAAKEAHARKNVNASDPDKNRWRHFRNMHYSAEHGLQRLQDEKKKHGIPLDLGYAPVVIEGSAVILETS